MNKVKDYVGILTDIITNVLIGIMCRDVWEPITKLLRCSQL